MSELHSQPWEDPDWYDLHDTQWTAGTQREPEHYNELVLALPPLGSKDHLVDVGTGTGKLAQHIGSAYPKLGRVTLIEPNDEKLQVAQTRYRNLNSEAVVIAVCESLGSGRPIELDHTPSLVTFGSVLMPLISLLEGSLDDGMSVLIRTLTESVRLAGPGCDFFFLETLAAPWEVGNGVRRLHYFEFVNLLTRSGFVEIECRYRMRDRILISCKSSL